MSSCSSIDQLITPFVDGEIGPSDGHLVAAHLMLCESCRSRVAAEQVVRDLMRERKPAMCASQAPALLRTRCAAAAAQTAPAGAGDAAATRVANVPLHPAPPAAARRARLAPLAAAASLVLIVGGAFLYQATAYSPRLMAAELAADHMKCFAMNAALGTHQSVEAVQSAMASGFGWNIDLPHGAAGEGLELVGSRPCLYGNGEVAHIMYRHHGRPVSLFMLPRTERPEQLVKVLGHQCAIWSSGDRTFVLVAREPRSDVERLAAFVHAAVR
jgi:anti-sigma factor RsiW